MTAYCATHYDSRAHKYLSDQRLDYFDQSRRTVGGVVAPFIARPRLPASAPSDVGAGQLHTNTAGAGPARQEIPR